MKSAASTILHTAGATPSPVVPISQPVPALVTREQAAHLLSISLVSLKRWSRSGRFGPSPIKLGRCSRYRRDELLAWANAGCPHRRDWKWTSGGAA
jgi:predicted DNA-binding transcriptional regulator AlpA